MDSTEDSTEESTVDRDVVSEVVSDGGGAVGGETRSAGLVRPAGRYGEDRPAWHRVLARVLTVALAVVAVGFLVWVAVDDEGQEVVSTDVGFRELPATSEGGVPDRVEVDFVVAMDPGTSATCTLRALNARFAVVGVADVDVDASSVRSQRVSGVVRVSEPAVSAGVQRCVVR